MKLPMLTNVEGGLNANYYALNKIYGGQFGIRLQADAGTGTTCTVTDEDITNCASKLLPLYQKCVVGSSTMSCLWQLRTARAALNQCKPCLANSKDSVEKVLQKLATTPPDDGKKK